MTTIDGDRLPGSIPNVPGHVLTRIDELSRLLGRSPAEVVTLAFATFAPPVETRFRPASPDDGWGTGPTATGPVPLHDITEVIAQPIPHIHLDLQGHPCVYGDRCGR